MRRDYLADAQLHQHVTAPYLHEYMTVEVTWQHDVPVAMIFLESGPGADAIGHFDTAFYTAERNRNRLVNPTITVW